MRLVVLVGSGASVGAGMPNVAKITEQVLSGQNVLCSGSDFHLRDELPPHHEVFNQRLGPVLAFVGEIKSLTSLPTRPPSSGRATSSNATSRGPGRTRSGSRASSATRR